MNYLERCGIMFDEAVNCLLGGALNQTVSMRCALAQRDGKRWGCLACAFLSWAVQKNHCTDQFSDAPAPALVYVRAGIAFGVGIAAVAALVHAAVEILS
jgi:hypothetical protein